jgi:hypothetical protein
MAMKPDSNAWSRYGAEIELREGGCCWNYESKIMAILQQRIVLVAYACALNGLRMAFVGCKIGLVAIGVHSNTYFPQSGTGRRRIGPKTAYTDVPPEISAI